MRDREGLAPHEYRESRLPKVALPLLAVFAMAAVAAYVIPRGVQAQSMLAVHDDPAAIADRALATSFDASLATREIEQALAAKDSDLAGSFVELAHERAVPLPPELTARVDAAVKDANSSTAAAGNFMRGLIVGEPDDMVSLAGTVTGDLFVFGDIRDVVREGVHFVNGEQIDELVLGLACVGIAVTAGTYATVGTAAPARVGLSIAKAARRTGRIGAEMSASIGRLMHGVVDWDRLKTTVVGASLANPMIAVRAARDAVKVERAGGILDLARNTGRVQAKAGTQAALDGLKLSQSPADLARVAALAEKKGGKTRAILKTLGRGAIALTVGLLDLTVWLLGAVMTLFGFVSACKSATERLALRAIRRGKQRRLRAHAGLLAPG